jgi:hypothetical protein
VSLRQYLGVAVTAVLGLAAFAGTASADPAEVVNPSEAQGSGACTIFVFDGRYDGISTSVVKDSGTWMLQCHAILTRGEPVTSTELLRFNGNCLLVVTPSGIANETCTANRSIV